MSWQCVTAVLVLQVLTAAPLPWENTPRPWAWCQPSADLLFLFLCACLAQRLGVGPRLLAAAWAATSVLIPLYRFGESLLPTFYGKAFEPWIDVLELPALFHLVAHDRSGAAQLILLAGVLAAALLLLGTAYWAWRHVLRACAHERVAAAGLIAAQVLFAAAWCVHEANAGAVALLRSSMLRAALDDLGATVSTARWHGDAVVNERVVAAARELATTPQDLGALGGADVYFLIVESYGRALLSGRHRSEYEDWLGQRERELAAAGFAAAAGWVAPSVRGGGSCLAHAELLSGVDVEDRRVFDGLLASQVRTLAAIARDAGYRTVDVQPAMPRPWPEAKVLGFADHLFASAFTYRGHKYPWGDLPDQFALQHVLRTVVSADSRPLFLQYVGVSSHAPFAAVPPYHDDWAHAAAPDAYAGAPAAQWPITWTTYSNHPEIETAYLASIRYALRVAFGFAAQLRRRSLLVVVGDHQPPLPYATSADHAFDVPLHLLSNDATLLQPWGERGLQPGLVPHAAQQSFDAARFLFRFLRAYGRQAR